MEYWFEQEYYKIFTDSGHQVGSGQIIGLCPANKIELLCNNVSDWLDANLESALRLAM